MKKEYLSVKEVASKLSFSTQHVNSLCQKKILPCVKIGSVWRISHDKLDSMLNGEEFDKIK